MNTYDCELILMLRIHNNEYFSFYFFYLQIGEMYRGMYLSFIHLCLHTLSLCYTDTYMPLQEKKLRSSDRCCLSYNLS